MDLLAYIDDIPRRESLARKLRKNPLYLYQVATGWRGKRASPELAMAIEAATAKLGPETVTKESLRPDLWKQDTKAA
jgi:DNA-binding transcriptional regulator YdaS (Cro superfamily)